MKITRIYLSGNDSDFRSDDKDLKYTDVIVWLEGGKKYVASFFKYSYINKIKQKNTISGEYLNGKYFWDRNMILVDECTELLIKPVIEDIINEGNFYEAFRKL